MKEKHLALIGILLFAAWLFYVVWAIKNSNDLELKIRYGNSYSIERIK